MLLHKPEMGEALEGLLRGTDTLLVVSTDTTGGKDFYRAGLALLAVLLLTFWLPNRTALGWCSGQQLV